MLIHNNIYASLIRISQSPSIEAIDLFGHPPWRLDSWERWRYKINKCGFFSSLSSFFFEKKKFVHKNYVQLDKYRQSLLKKKKLIIRIINRLNMTWPKLKYYRRQKVHWFGYNLLQGKKNNCTKTECLSTLLKIIIAKINICTLLILFPSCFYIENNW